MNDQCSLQVDHTLIRAAKKGPYTLNAGKENLSQYQSFIDNQLPHFEHVIPQLLLNCYCKGGPPGGLPPGGPLPGGSVDMSTSEWIREMAKICSDNVDSFKECGSNLMKAVNNGVNKAVDNVEDLVDDAVDTIEDIVTDVLPDAVDNVVNTVVDVGNQVGNAVSNVVDYVAPVVTPVVDVVTDLIKDIGNTIGGWFG